VLGEAVLLTAGGAVIGLLGARALLPELSNAIGGTIPGIHLPLVTFLAGLAAAIVLALLATLPAAWRAQRLTITAALVAR
jgi:ABC-type antimicrobial peptide transport system permease subunit